MDKKKAIQTFGTMRHLAEAVGVTHGAVSQWPDPLPIRISDRVLAACVRQGIDPTPLLNNKANMQEAA